MKMSGFKRPLPMGESLPRAHQVFLPSTPALLSFHAQLKTRSAPSGLGRSQEGTRPRYEGRL